MEFFGFSSGLFYLEDYFVTLVGVAVVDGFELSSYAPSATRAAMTVATTICFVFPPVSLFLNSAERNLHIHPSFLSDIEK